MTNYAKRIEAKYVRDKDYPYQKKITSSQDVFDFAKVLRDETKEKFVALHMDSGNKVICFEVVSVGSLTAAIVEPREIFKTALLSNASALILIHNHPSGSLIPSPNDLMLTKRIKEAAKIVGFKILDHVIVTENGFHSMADEGLLDNM